MSAEQTVRLDGDSSVTIAGQPIDMSVTTTATTPIYTTPGAPPGQTFYFHTLTDTPGVVAANNFLSIFNPSGSAKLVIAYQATVIPYAGGAATTTESMEVFRTTAASAGTLIAASAVNRFVTTDANPVAEIRVGNPAATTTGTALIGFAPPLTSAGAGVGATGFTATPPGAGFVMLPGQGIVFRTPAGDVDQLWNIQFIWAEQSI